MKLAIAQVIATLALGLQLVFGVTIGEEVQSQIVDVVVGVVLVVPTLISIWKQIKDRNQNKGE